MCKNFLTIFDDKTQWPKEIAKIQLAKQRFAFFHILSDKNVCAYIFLMDRSEFKIKKLNKFLFYKIDVNKHKLTVTLILTLLLLITFINVTNNDISPLTLI